MDSSHVALTQAVLVLAILALRATNAADAPVEHEYEVEDEQTEMLAREEALETEAILQSGKHVVHVANNGIDDPTCGARLDPCRSISQAITNASAGGIILVGPGSYGDLNKDGALGGVGEEAGRCGAMICVDKAVRVLSLEGAERTVIDATGVTSPTNAVVILADDVRFGLVNRGFTVRGARNHAVRAQSARVWIIDNIATAAAGGFVLYRPSFECLLIGNRSLGNDLGFTVFGDNHHLELNVAQSNTSSGFWLDDNGHRLRSNTAVGNAIGALIVGSNHRLTRNAFIGNSRSGVNVLQQVTGLVVRYNNIFGNGEGLGGALNRGLVNASGSLVRATNNFWGSATGPGPNPADQIFTNRLSQTQFEPVAMEAFNIRSAR